MTSWAYVDDVTMKYCREIHVNIVQQVHKKAITEDDLKLC